jgi:fucose permease
MLNDKKIIRKTDFAAMTTMFFFASSATIIPISLVNITKDLSITLTQISILNFISTIQLLIALLLSCYITARFGKIKLVRVALILAGVGLSLGALCRNFWHVLIVMVLTGFGSGFFEGVLSPMVKDLHPDDNGRNMNLVHAFWPIGVCATLLLVGELLSRGVSWRIIFPALGILMILVNIIYPASRKLNLPKSRTDFKHTLEIFSKPRFWFLGMALFFSAGAEGGFAFWTASYIQIHFETLPRAGGLGAAFFAVGMVIGRVLTSRLAHKFKLKSLLLLFSSGAFILSLLFFLLVPSLYILFAFMIAMGFTIACLWPSIQSYTSSVLDVDPTMVMIYLACFGAIGYSSGTAIMGIIGDNLNLQASFIIAPVYLIILIIILLLENRIFSNSKA